MKRDPRFSYDFILQVLSELDIVVPLQLLISMFSDGVNSVKELANQRKVQITDVSGNIPGNRVTPMTFSYLWICSVLLG